MTHRGVSHGDRYFAIAAGLVYVLVGLMGFVPGINVPGPPDAPDIAVDSFYGYLLGLFPENLLHNLVQLVSGAWGIWGYTKGIPGSRLFACGLTVVYGVLAVMGLMPVLTTTFGLIPIFGHDVCLHAGTALLAAYFGWMHHVDLGDWVADRVEGLGGRR
jgi:Domain of unknown function (DUF4383)